jgi:hypothetical protein
MNFAGFCSGCHATHGPGYPGSGGNFARILRKRFAPAMISSKPS